MLFARLRMLAVAVALMFVPVIAQAACPAAWQPGALTNIEGAQLEVLQQICRNGFVSSVTVTRPNDTNAYTANDVVGAATGATAAIVFSNIGPTAGGEVIITSTELEIDAAAIISGETSYTLYCYSAAPPSALGDNAAFDIPSGDRSVFIGKIALGTPVDEGSTLYIRQDAVNQQFTVPVGGSFQCYPVTIGGYTPTALRVYKFTLHGVGM